MRPMLAWRHDQMLMNPAGAIKGRLNSQNFTKPSTVKWLRPKIAFSDVDLTVNQDNWHTYIEGKDIGDWKEVAAIKQYWDAYRLIKNRLHAGQRKTCDAVAAMGGIACVVLHHSRLKDGFTGPTTKQSEDKQRRVFIGATGPLMCSESDLAHPYIHTPLLIKCQFFHRLFRDEALAYVADRLPDGCHVLVNDWPGTACEKDFYVKLPVPQGDLLIEDIDNDEAATLICANVNTFFAEKYGRLTPIKLVQLVESSSPAAS